MEKRGINSLNQSTANGEGTNDIRIAQHVAMKEHNLHINLRRLFLHTHQMDLRD